MKYSSSWFLFGLVFLLGLQGYQVIAQTAEGKATVEEIVDNTDNWVGKTVTITGTFDELKDDSSFTIEGDNYFDGDRVLIINESGQPLPKLPEENITLRITGKVDLVEGDRYFDFENADIPENIVDEYESQPAVCADSIVLAPDPVEIVEAPANFYDRDVAVSGKVAEVLDNNAFTLKEFSLSSDQNLLVLNMSDEPMPESGAEVLIMGQVRAYDQEQLEREYGYDEDLNVYTDTNDSEEASETAVLIVEEIAPIDVDLSDVDVDVSP